MPTLSSRSAPNGRPRAPTARPSAEPPPPGSPPGAPRTAPHPRRRPGREARFLPHPTQSRPGARGGGPPGAGPRRPRLRLPRPGRRGRLRAARRSGPEAAGRAAYCFTLSPSASLRFFLAASSSLTKVAIAPAPGPTAEPPPRRATEEPTRRRPRAGGPVGARPPAPPPDARKTSLWLSAPPACLKGKGGANPRSAQPSCPPLGSHDLSARRGCSATCWAGASSPLPWVFPHPRVKQQLRRQFSPLSALHFCQRWSSDRPLGSLSG